MLINLVIFILLAKFLFVALSKNFGSMTDLDED